MAKRGRLTMDGLFKIDGDRGFAFKRGLCLGKRTIMMHFQDEESRKILARPFSHLADDFRELEGQGGESSGDRDLDIFVVHDGEGGDPLPIWKKFEGESSEDRKLVIYRKEGRHLLYNHESKVLAGYDRRTRRAYYYIPSLDILPYYEKAAPMRMIFHHFCEENSMALVHGASVAMGGKGLLLIGRGGSGKTTTAISAALRGFDYLGDDYVILGMEDRSIYSLYSSSKIRWESGQIVKGLESLAVNSRKEDKGYFFMEDHGRSIKTRATLAGVVIPRIGQKATTWGRIPSPKALLILSSTTIFQMPGSGNKTLKDIARILKDLPVFEMVLGRDIDQTNAGLEEIIKGL